MKTGGIGLKEFLISKILSEFKDSVAIQTCALETKLRDRLEKKSKIELMSLKIRVEVTAQTVPKGA